jgi:signal transduction histidine kinase
MGLPILIGRIVFNRRRRLLLERDSVAREAVTLERTRIARELHDVVAHAMSVMIVQAGAARTVVDRDPQAAHDAIAQVEETGRAGLAEMRRLIGVLTDDGQAGSTAPMPGLAQLDPLLDTVRSAGLPVEVVRTGAARELAAGADLAAYRVIQESLTNALKHAGPASAVVTLHYAADRVTIEVADDGRGPAAEPGVGHGLIGMRERVGMFGGSLETSARPGGGFVVHAEIPVEEEA